MVSSVRRWISIDLIAAAAILGGFLHHYYVLFLRPQEAAGRLAGYYQTVKNQQSWWDATDATLPDYAQDLTWVKALTEAGMPADIITSRGYADTKPVAPNTTDAGRAKNHRVEVVVSRK